MKANLADSAADDLEQRPEDFRQVLGKMFTEEALTSNTIKMVEGLLRDGFMNVGLEIRSKVEKTKEVPRVVTDTAVIKHYAARSRTKDALRVFKHMSVSGVEPNAYTYSVIIKALAAAGPNKNPNFVAYAKNYFVEMLDRGMQPNEKTFLAVLEGIGCGENKAEAEKERIEFVDYVKAKGFQLLLKKEAEERDNPSPMKSEMERLKEHAMKVFEDATKDCQDKDLQETFREIGEDYDSISLYAFDLYNLLVRKGFDEESLKLFKPLVETAILPDEVIFLIVILMCKTEDNVLKAYEQMIAYGIIPSSCTYNFLIATLAKDPNFIGQAKKFYLEMLDKVMKPFLHTTLAVFNGIACLESFKDAMEFFELVKPKGVLPDADESRFIAFLRGMMLYDDLDKKTTDKDVKKVIKNIKLNGFDEELAKMVHAMLQDGNTHEVAELFPSTGHPHINPMVIIYTAVMESYIIGGKTKEAFCTYLDMLAAGLAPISYTYSVLVKGLAADPKFFGDAKKYLIEMMDKGMHPGAATYTAVFETFEREDDKATEEGKKFMEVLMVKGLYLTLRLFGMC